MNKFIFPTLAMGVMLASHSFSGVDVNTNVTVWPQVDFSRLTVKATIRDENTNQILSKHTLHPHETLNAFTVLGGTIGKLLHVSVKITDKFTNEKQKKLCETGVFYGNSQANLNINVYDDWQNGFNCSFIPTP